MPAKMVRLCRTIFAFLPFICVTPTYGSIFKKEIEDISIAISCFPWKSEPESGDIGLQLIPLRSRHFISSDILCIVGVIAFSLAGIAEITKYFHGPKQFLFAIAIAASVTLVMIWLRWRHLNSTHELRIRWLVILWAGFTLLFAILYPISQRHVLGVGSDREDALRVADHLLIHGRYLYDGHTFLGNSITPLPGAVLLALPFYFLGSVALQNLLWLALFIAFSSWFFRNRSTALAYVLILLGASAGNMDDFVVGGDFFINELYVCIAFALVLAACEDEIPAWMQFAAGVLLGFAVDSRPIYVVVFPLLFAYLWKRLGPAPALRAVLISGFTALLLSVPFYLYDPAHFAPLHIKHKLDFIPAQYHATIVLPVFGLLVSCIGFFIPLTRPRVYLLIGLSLFVMLGIPGWIRWFEHPFTLYGWYGVGLSGVPAPFITLWIFSHYQQTGRRLRAATRSPS